MDLWFEMLGTISMADFVAGRRAVRVFLRCVFSLLDFRLFAIFLAFHAYRLSVGGRVAAAQVICHTERLRCCHKSIVTGRAAIHLTLQLHSECEFPQVLMGHF